MKQPFLTDVAGSRSITHSPLCEPAICTGNLLVPCPYNASCEAAEVWRQVRGEEKHHNHLYWSSFLQSSLFSPASVSGPPWCIQLLLPQEDVLKIQPHQPELVVFISVTDTYIDWQVLLVFPWTMETWLPSLRHFQSFLVCESSLLSIYATGVETFYPSWLPINRGEQCSNTSGEFRWVTMRAQDCSAGVLEIMCSCPPKLNQQLPHPANYHIKSIAKTEVIIQFSVLGHDEKNDYGNNLY